MTDVLSPAKNWRPNQETVDRVINNLPLGRVEPEIINRASFNPNNTFTPGEIVITPSLNGVSYFYSCVTGNYVDVIGSRSVRFFSVIRHFHGHNYRVGFTAAAIGKLNLSNASEGEIEILTEQIRRTSFSSERQTQ